MAKIKIITDSASDISSQAENELDILVLPFKVVLGDKSYTSRVDFDNEQFYKMMNEYDGMPTHSQITLLSSPSCMKSSSMKAIPTLSTSA